MASWWSSDTTSSAIGVGQTSVCESTCAGIVWVGVDGEGTVFRGRPRVLPIVIFTKLFFINLDIFTHQRILVVTS
jgi:hypothetical protein